MHQLLESEGKLYKLIRLIKHDQFDSPEHADEYKLYIHCDHILQDAENYAFCRNIDDVEFEMIEDIN